jgi:hypothetical protein
MRLAYDDDDLDELLAAHFPESKKDSDGNADLTSAEADDDESENFISSLPLRRPEPNYPKNRAVWLTANLMSRTEASLRLARYLLHNRLTSSDVHVSLTGYELTRRWKPKFPVESFLRERLCVREGVGDDWRGTYAMKGADHMLTLDSAPRTADVTATLLSNDRLVAHVSRGTLKPSRSSAEHKALRAVIGRALTFEHYLPNDIMAAVVPRSPRYRALAARWRQILPIARTGLLILTVDRTGRVHGLELGK